MDLLKKLDKEIDLKKEKIKGLKNEFAMAEEKEAAVSGFMAAKALKEENKKLEFLIQKRSIYLGIKKAKEEFLKVEIFFKEEDQKIICGIFNETLEGVLKKIGREG